MGKNDKRLLNLEQRWYLVWEVIKYHADHSDKETAERQSERGTIIANKIGAEIDATPADSIVGIAARFRYYSHFSDRMDDDEPELLTVYKEIQAMVGHSGELMA